MNLYKSSPFRGVNTDLNQKRGGYKPGRIGVSDFGSKTLDYNRPGQNSLPTGAGVSVMTTKPAQVSNLDPADFNIYQKEPVNSLYRNFYK
jgi:hypothetical protein